MDRKGAISLSISTMVIIVIGVMVLVLAISFVSQIFGVATESVSVIDQQVKGKLQTMLGEEQGKLVVTFAKTANVKAGTQGFSIPFAARTPKGEAIRGSDDIEYKISKGAGNCDGLGDWLLGDLGRWQEVDEYEADTSFTRIVLSVPKGTEVCTQKVAVDVRFKGTEYGRTSFTLNVIRGGLF